MASANMKDIKRRIKSVESTMQITKAMELVANSKLRRAKNRADTARPFFDSLSAAMSEISANSKGFQSVFITQRPLRSVLLIVIAGDRGLAGGFNSNVLKAAMNEITRLKTEGVEPKVMAIGKKSVEFFQKRNVAMLEGGSYSNVAEAMTIYYGVSFAHQILSGYRSDQFQQVQLYYTTFISTLSQEVRRQQILPFVPASPPNGQASALVEYDPSPEAVFESIVPKYLAGLLFGAVADSYAAEQAARRTAMESASDNAGDMINHLSLQYNRARQATITQEITEIVSGSNALN